MIKPYYDITIRDYNILEKTGEMKHFITGKMPLFLIKNKIEKELDRIKEVLNNKDSEGNEDLIWEAVSLAKINAVEASFMGILNLLELGQNVNELKKELNRGSRRKIKFTDKNLQKYISTIAKHSKIHIEITTFTEDLEAVRKEIEWRKDKFNENFTNKPNPKKVYLMSIAMGVFSYLDEKIDMNMTVIEFSALREKASEKMQNNTNK
jgi:hypothetical protein